MDREPDKLLLWKGSIVLKYTCIFFDIDNCLMDTPTSERRTIKALYAQQGQIVGDEVTETYRRINKELWVHLDAGEITRKELEVKRFRELFKIYPFFKTPEEVSPWFLDRWATAIDPMPGADHLLQRLTEAGVRVYTASNGIGKTMNGRVAGAGLDKWVTGAFSADEIGFMKPAYEYFDYIFRESGETDKHKALFVGDNPVTDVDGALDYGMDACLLGWRYTENPRATYSVPTMKALEDILFDGSEQTEEKK